MRPTLRGAVTAAALLLIPGAALADVTAQSEFGFEGGYVRGSINPVRVELTSSEKTPIAVLLEVHPPSPVTGGSSETVTYRAEVFLAPGARKRITIPVLVREDPDGPWRLKIVTERGTLIRHGQQYEDGRSLTVDIGSTGNAGSSGFSLESAEPVVGLVAGSKAGISWLERVATSPGVVIPAGMRQTAEAPIRVPSLALVPPATAPSPWLCYEGLDAVLWIAPNPGLFSDDAQLDALLDYAENGGRLVLVLTPDTAVSATSPLAPALAGLPSRYEDVPLNRVVTALNDGPTSGALPATPVAVARLLSNGGRVLRSLPGPDGLPLVLQKEWGLGTVVTVTCDLSRLSTIPDFERDALLKAMFGPCVVGSIEGEEYYSGISQERLTSHLRKRFLSAPPLWVLVIGLVLYVLAIGPVDYFWLKKRKQLRRTVVTFPIIVVGFTLLAYGGSFLLFGGQSGRTRVAWIDLASAPSGDADAMRGLDIVGSYSPTGTTLEQAWHAEHAFIEAPWFGLGASRYQYGGGGGGIDAVVEYGADGLPRIELDVPLRSHRTLCARWSREIPASLEARVLVKEDGTRTLELHNGLPERVRDLVYHEGGRRADGTSLTWIVGNLEAGERIEKALDGAPAASHPAFPPFPDSAPVLRPPFLTYGLFGAGNAYGSNDNDFFVPQTRNQGNEAARTSMAHAAMGSTFSGLGTPSATLRRAARVLGRQGMDLTTAVRDGRGALVGWCDRDPTGVMPADGRFDSTVVVLRRLLPFTTPASGAGEKEKR